jgi:hypothetical protein
MRRVSIRFVAGIALASGIALARGAEDHPTAQLHDCSPTERAEGLECPEKAPQNTAPRQAYKGNDWSISLTTSPVDYSPVATATTSSRDGAGESGMKLSIRCRGGRNELVVAGPSIPRRGDDYAISFRVNGSQGMQIAAAVPASGIGVAFRGDVVRLLRSLPDGGSLSIHLTSRMGTALDAVFSLGGLEAARAKMTTACRWPQPAAKHSG